MLEELDKRYSDFLYCCYVAYAMLKWHVFFITTLSLCRPKLEKPRPWTHIASNSKYCLQKFRETQKPLLRTEAWHSVYSVFYSRTSKAACLECSSNPPKN